MNAPIAAKRERSSDAGGVRGGTPKELDQYFTADATAEACVQSLRPILHRFEYIVEPSAGGGAFIRALGPECASRLIHMDIDAADEAHRVDYLSPHTRIPTSNSNILTIGNPPFGRRSDKALAFFNKAATHSAVIAFVLPRSFRKISVSSHMDRRFFLAHETLLGNRCFTFQDKPYARIQGVWQVWVRNTDALRLFGMQLPDPPLRAIPKLIMSVTDFAFVKSESEEIDAVIQRVGHNCGQVIVDPQRMAEKTSHNYLYIHVSDPTQKQAVIDRLIALDLRNDPTKYDIVGTHYSIAKSRVCQLYLEATKK